jgi:hypothetical protein
MKRDERLKDFRVFLTMVWRHLRLSDPTPAQLDFAYWLQHGPKRGVGQAFRGFAKSWITSVFVVWSLYWDNTNTILVVSASKARADNFSTFTIRLLEDIPFLRHMRPSDEQRSSKIEFDVAGAPPSHAASVKSVGIYGQITGSRARLVIADDVESRGNSATQMMRAKLAEAIKEFDAVLSPGGRILFLGTPQTEESIYNRLPDRGYETRIWPAKYVDPKKSLKYGGMLAPFILERAKADQSLVGKSIDPTRFSDLDLVEREASYGRSGFALQFMLDTSMSDALRFPLKLADLSVMDLPLDLAPERVLWGNGPDLVLKDLPNVGFSGDWLYRPMQTLGAWLPYTGMVMAIDPSGRGKDETAYAIVGALHGQLFVQACRGLRTGYDDSTMIHLAEAAKRHKVKHILVEENFGQGMFGKLLQPHLVRIGYPCTVEEVRHSKQKEHRIIDTLEPVLNQHRLIFSSRVVREDSHMDDSDEVGLEDEGQLRYQLLYQLTRVNRERGALAFDDRLDALSMAVAYWVNSMARDVDNAKKEREQALYDKELQEFARRARHFLGKTPLVEKTWASYHPRPVLPNR